MVNLNLLAKGALLFLLGQCLVFWQVNGQFIWELAKKYPLVMSLFGIPISFVYIYATDYLVQAFDGAVWPSRLLGFSMGILAFTTLTLIHLGEAINLKTSVILMLAIIIVLLQVLWK